MTALPHLRDVSNYQPHIDWAAEAKEVVGCYVNVSQGLTWTDPYAASHIAGARKARIPVGGYHFCTPGNGSGEQQADRLLALAPRRPGDLRPCLDIEANPLKLPTLAVSAWLVGAITRIVTVLGCFPTVYGSPDFLTTVALSAPKVFGRCPLWVANYGVAAPKVPAPWHSWQAWQWTSTWRDTAAGGGVDDSLVAELAALRIPARMETLRVRRAARKLPLRPWQSLGGW